MFHSCGRGKINLMRAANGKVSCRCQNLMVSVQYYCDDWKMMFSHNNVQKASDFILFMYVIDASTVFIHCIHQQVSKQNFIKGKSKMFYLLDLNCRGDMELLKKIWVLLSFVNLVENDPESDLDSSNDANPAPDPPKWSAGFRIRIDLKRIRIRIRIQYFF